MNNYQLAIAAAVCVRIAFTLYGEYMDAHTRGPKYTDIDYHVFSDAAYFVTQGQSPYLRDTYRYTPMLAWLMQINHYSHQSAGKWLLLMCDCAIAWLMHKIVAKQDPLWAPKAALIWLWNPLGIAISTRGNAESVLILMILLCLYSLMQRRTVQAAAWLGLAVHFKVYPILYVLPCLVYIGSDYCHMPHSRTLTSLFNKERWKFALVNVAVFVLLGAWMYSLYGWEFIEHTYTYHLGRRDHRHNFSPYFLSIYMSFEMQSSHLLSLAAFVPQFVLAITAGFLYGKDLVYACFLQTFVFVHFNKVITSQYFVWYLCFIPILARNLVMSKTKMAVTTAVWFAGQGLWLSQAYRLEIMGEHAFVNIWLAGLVHFVCQTGVLLIIIGDYRSSLVQNTTKTTKEFKTT